MIKVIAVDFGGVYFTWSADEHVRRFTKLTSADPEVVRKALFGRIRDLHVRRISEKEYWDYFCRAVGKDMDRKLLLKVIVDQMKPIRPVINLVKKLRRKYTIVMLSNQTPVMNEVEKRYKYHRNFDILLLSHVVRMQKPYKNIYRLLIKKTKARPEEIVFIDDLERNLIPARKMGIKCILFKNATQLKRDLKKLGVSA